MATAYVPGVAEFREHDPVAVLFARRLTGAATQETVNPVLGVTFGVRLTLPAKLKMLDKLTVVDALATPELKFTGVAADIVKSPTCATELVERDAVPGDPVPVTVTK